MKYLFIGVFIGVLGLGVFYSQFARSESHDTKISNTSKKTRNKSKKNEKQKKAKVRKNSRRRKVRSKKIEKINISSYLKIIEKLKPLHKKVIIKRGDWLVTQKEPGQTFKQYIKCKPILPTSNRRIIYIYPIGVMDNIWKKIVKITKEFMEIFFNLPVEIKDTIPAKMIPAKQRRIKHGRTQLNAEYILEHILLGKVTKKAVAVTGITAWDLFEDPTWNFVFGLAYTEDRASVSSFARYGDPKKDYKTVLIRVLGTVVHETGHMFTMEHCIEYDCVMCGSMSLRESDRRGIWLCPHCVAKFSWAFKTDVLKRFKKLKDFFKKYNFKQEVKFYDNSIALLEKK